jgi:hypothetical protein
VRNGPVPEALPASRSNFPRLFTTLESSAYMDSIELEGGLRQYLDDDLKVIEDSKSVGGLNSMRL